MSSINLFPTTGWLRTLCYITMVLATSCPMHEVVADFRLGAFNIKIFGVTKAGKPDVMDILAKIVRRYDILLIQEIRDISNTAIWDLLDETNTGQPAVDHYSVALGPRVGRTSSKEQYAFFYKEGRGVKIVGNYTYDDGEETEARNDTFEREPFIVHVLSDNTALGEFVLAGIHVRPDDAVAEIGALTDVFDDARARFGVDNVMVFGDLNADCSYAPIATLDTMEIRNASVYTWYIGDDEDTTLSATNCAYDRFIVSGGQWSESITAGSAHVYNFDNDPEYIGTIDAELALDVSDHYPIDLNLTARSPVTTSSPTTSSPVTTTSPPVTTTSSPVTTTTSPVTTTSSPVTTTTPPVTTTTPSVTTTTPPVTTTTPSVTTTTPPVTTTSPPVTTTTPPVTTTSSPVTTTTPPVTTTTPPVTTTTPPVTTTTSPANTTTPPVTTTTYPVTTTTPPVTTTTPPVTTTTSPVTTTASTVIVNVSDVYVRLKKRKSLIENIWYSLNSINEVFSPENVKVGRLLDNADGNLISSVNSARRVTLQINLQSAGSKIRKKQRAQLILEALQMNMNALIDAMAPVCNNPLHTCVGP